MKAHALTALLFAFTLGLSPARAQDPETRGEQGDTLTPLAMGNTWVYSSEEGDTVTTDRVEGVVMFDGRPWHLLRSYEHAEGQPADKGELVSDNFWLTFKDGHEWDAWAELSVEDELETFKLTTLSKYYKYPVALGEIYKPQADDPALKITVSALNAKLKTPAGEFECVVYTQTNADEPGYRFTSWVAPGVGIVKNETVEDGETSVSELISYTLVEK